MPPSSTTSDPAAAIVGSWEVAVRPDALGRTFVNLSTFVPGGGLINSVGGHTGHGTWAWTDGSSYAMTIVLSDLDEEGQETARSTVTATLTLAPDGASFEGPYVNVVTDGAGVQTDRFAGTARGTRIAVTPMP